MWSIIEDYYQRERIMIKKEMLLVMLVTGFVATNGLAMESEGKAEEKKCLREVLGWNDASDDKVKERELHTLQFNVEMLMFNLATLSGDKKTQQEIIGKWLVKSGELFHKMHPQLKEQIREEELRQEKLRRHEFLMHQMHEDNYR